MRLRNAALVASRILAIYIGFHALIYAGEFAHDLIRMRPLAVLARSVAPICGFMLVAGALWWKAPRIADAMMRGAPEPDEGEPAATGRELGAIAFGVAGLLIAAQATPLLASTIQRLVGGVWSTDATGDVLAAATRIVIGALVFANARRLSNAILGRATTNAR
jgi:hypothetical protein